MNFKGTVARMLSRYGATWTIRKRSVAAGANAWTAGSTTDTFAQFVAHGRDATPEEIGNGGLQQGDFVVSADATSFASAPVKDDLIALGTHASMGTGQWMQIVDPPSADEAGTPRVYRLRARR